MIPRFLILGLLVAAAPLARAQELTQLMSCLRANLPNGVRVDSLQFKTYGAGGREALVAASLITQREKDLWRAVMKVQAPPDLRGLAYLLREEPGADAVYTYGPGFDGARRVADEDLGGSLFGTAFSYRDLQAVFGAWQNAQIVLHPSSRSGATFQTVSVYPEQTGHRVEILAEIEAQHCVVLQADVLEGGVVRKRLRADPATLRSAGTYWYAGSIEVRDLKENTSTTLQIDGATPGRPGVPRNFSPTTFFLGP